MKKYRTICNTSATNCFAKNNELPKQINDFAKPSMIFQNKSIVLQNESMIFQIKISRLECWSLIFSRNI